MATKYTRESRQHQRLAAVPHPKPWRFAASPKRRLVMIYLGVGFFVLVLGFAHLLLDRMPFLGQPIQHGRGMVTDKTIQPVGDTSHYIVVVSIPSPGSGTARGRFETDKESWHALRIGQALQLDYRLSQSGHRALVEGVTPVSPR